MGSTYDYNQYTLMQVLGQVPALLEPQHRRPLANQPQLLDKILHPLGLPQLQACLDRYDASISVVGSAIWKPNHCKNQL